MRKINRIIIHCSATGPSQNFTSKNIELWHTTPKPKGNGWDHIGYHFVILRNGYIEEPLDLEIPGYHVSGYNKNSIGICLIGGIQDGKGGDANQDGIIEEFENGQKGVPEANYTPEQWEALDRLVHALKKDFPHATVHGHREFAAKACPCFDVQKWWKDKE